MEKTRLLIDITINQNSKIFNDYNGAKLSDELSAYIYRQCKGTPAKKNVNINIYHSHNVSSQEKKNIIDAIRSDFGVDIKENILRLKEESVKELILLLVGSFLLIISKLFILVSLDIIGEIFSIFAWVTIWEAAYNCIFMNTKIRFKNKRLKKIVESRIEFILKK